MFGLLSSTTGCVPTLISHHELRSVRELLRITGKHKYISIEDLEAAKRTPEIRPTNIQGKVPVCWNASPLSVLESEVQSNQSYDE